jgi:RES domain-containing protein
MAFSGEGTRLVGSRWTERGAPSVYTSQSIALAALETLVHLEIKHLPAYVVIPVDIPKDLKIEVVDSSALPRNWTQTPSPMSLQRIGTEWLRSQKSVVLQVPSAVVPDEFNYILNPIHPDFGNIEIGKLRPFRFDRRLVSPTR